jgi:hypothetical protein
MNCEHSQQTEEPNALKILFNYPTKISGQIKTINSLFVVIFELMMSVECAELRKWVKTHIVIIL